MKLFWSFHCCLFCLLYQRLFIPLRRFSRSSLVVPLFYLHNIQSVLTHFKHIVFVSLICERCEPFANRLAHIVHHINWTGKYRLLFRRLHPPRFSTSIFSSFGYGLLMLLLFFSLSSLLHHLMCSCSSFYNYAHKHSHAAQLSCLCVKIVGLSHFCTSLSCCVYSFPYLGLFLYV